MLTTVWMDSTRPLVARPIARSERWSGIEAPTCLTSPSALGLLHLVHPIALRAEGGPPDVQLEQVDAVHAQFLEGLLGAAPDLAARVDKLTRPGSGSPAAAGAEGFDLGGQDGGCSPDQLRRARPTTASDWP